MDKYYRYWSSERGSYTEVKKLRYLGLRGWKGHVQKKVRDGITYAGEVYECISIEGEKMRCVFRVIYDSVDTSVGNYEEHEKILDEITNYHTDGILAWQTGNFKDRDNRSLIRREKELKEKIIKLKEIFDSLNNLENAELKLAVQLYLRRLETPDHVTSKEWGKCAIKQQVLDLL
jgi:hypothetical protein